jgi:hypothetical protein
VALIEVHRVMTGGQVEAVDLLSPHPTPMRVLDRSLAAVAARFSTLLTWTFPTPHYWRMSGTAMIIPDVAQFSAPEIVREIVKHLGGPLTEAEMRQWLAENFARFDASLTAVAQRQRQQMLAGMDAQWGTSVYELQAPPAQCRKRLDALAEVEPDDLADIERDEGFVEARDWFDTPLNAKPLAAPGGQVLLGRVLLGPSRWRLETMGAEKLSRLRRQFEVQMGRLVRFSSECVDDLGTRLALQEPAGDQALVPPSLLENPTQYQMATSRVVSLPPGVLNEDALQEILRAAERAFLDESVPALDNRTPREAARDPVLRPKLVQLMKQRIRGHDEHNLQTGQTDDLNWMLHELGLPEMIFDAPPWRPPPKPLSDMDEDWAGAADFAGPAGMENHRPPAPPLPAEPLEVEAAIRRLHNAMDCFSTTAEAEAELAASGATILDDAEELTLDCLSENDFCMAIPFLLQVWFALVPRGCRAPKINYEGLEKTFRSNLQQMTFCIQDETPEKLESFFKSSPQPDLILALMGEFMETVHPAPKKFRPSLNSQPVILALLKSVMEQLDAALGRK